MSHRKVTKGREALAEKLAGIRPANAISGYLFMAFKPDLFVPLADYREEVRRRIETIRATPRQPGVDEIRIPGERSHQTRQRLAEEGLEIERKIHTALTRLAEGRADHGA